MIARWRCKRLLKRLAFRLSIKALSRTIEDIRSYNAARTQF